MRARFFAVLLVVLLQGCAAGLGPQTDRLTESDRLRNSGRVEDALALLRAEYADPRYTNDPQARGVYLRQRLLIALGEYSTIVGLKPEIEAEAARHYEEGLAQFARDNVELQTFMHNGRGVYYSWTWRPGLAVQYFRKEEAFWEARNDPQRLFLMNDALAKSYYDMGEFDLWRYRVGKALDAGPRYFVPGVRPKEVHLWEPYNSALIMQMDYAAQLGDIALMEKLQSLRLPIYGRVYRIRFEGPAVAADKFAVAGDLTRARALLEEGRAMWEQEKGAWADNPRVLAVAERQLTCIQGSIELRTGNSALAASLIDRCITMLQAQRVKFNLATLLRLRGRAYEGAGDTEKALADYRAAIAAAEVTRESIGVAERANFFRTTIRRPYWGLTRVQAKRAAAGDEAAFFEAVFASEQIRGRQLGELTDPQMAKRISPASLKALRERLPADAAILAYTVTEDQIVILGLARERVFARVVPYDAKAFTELARGIAAELADPALAARPGAARNLAIGRTQAPASPQALDARLVAMSRLLLSPAREFMAGKKRIIALPDGIMNTVPFELLSVRDDLWRPLIVEHTVSAAPSLLFTQYAGRPGRAEGDSLLVLADPKYAKPQVLAGASVDEVKIATRGSRYLQYFQPLPETRTEAQAIAKMFAGQRADLLVGEFALESEIKKRDLLPYRYLHFATHGILGGEVPGVGEPALVLGEEPGEDGFLTATEVGKLRINAQLTVLSACNTGSGEFVTGEGVMGMSRAFLAAGSLSVVVSLWPVASQFTERLMVEFYRQLRAGQPAPEALRAAKLELMTRAQKEGSPEAHPFYWAPFILLGG